MYATPWEMGVALAGRLTCADDLAVARSMCTRESTSADVLRPFARREGEGVVEHAYPRGTYADADAPLLHPVLLCHVERSDVAVDDTASAFSAGRKLLAPLKLLRGLQLECKLLLPKNEP